MRVEFDLAGSNEMVVGPPVLVTARVTDSWGTSQSGGAAVTVVTPI